MILCSDARDFNSTNITAIFRATEGHSDLNVPIPIFDDDVDEAHRQFFIAHLVLTNAMDKDLIKLGRTVSTCTIIDNDGKWMFVYS